MDSRLQVGLIANLYRRHSAAFRLMLAKPLSQTTTDDVRRYFEDHATGTIASRATALSAVKSLLSYAVKNRFDGHNPGADVRCRANGTTPRDP